MLTVQDSRIVTITLEGLENFLKVGQIDAKGAVNPYSLLIEEAYGKTLRMCCCFNLVCILPNTVYIRYWKDCLWMTGMIMCSLVKLMLNPRFCIALLSPNLVHIQDLFLCISSVCVCVKSVESRPNLQFYWTCVVYQTLNHYSIPYLSAMQSLYIEGGQSYTTLKQLKSQ